jgi:hypothetical protein
MPAGRIVQTAKQDALMSKVRASTQARSLAYALFVAFMKKYSRMHASNLQHLLLSNVYANARFAMHSLRFVHVQR